MDRIGIIVFYIPSWRLKAWIARLIGKPVPGGWTIGTRVMIFDPLVDD